GAAGRHRVRATPGGRPRTPVPPRARCRPPAAAGPAAGRGAVQRRLRRLGGGGSGRGRAVVPAPLPGRPRGGGVPRAVRRRGRGLRPAAGHSGAPPGHHRARRRSLHHTRQPPRHRLPDRRGPHPAGHGPTTPRQDVSSRRIRVMTSTAHPELEGLGTYEYGLADPDVACASDRRGLDEEVVRDISAKEDEPEWMRDLRLKALRLFTKKPLPNWGADLSKIDFDNIKYFVRSTEKQATSWEELPEDIRRTYDKLGIPEAEKQRLVAGVAAQYESE